MNNYIVSAERFMGQMTIAASPDKDATIAFARKYATKRKIRKNWEKIIVKIWNDEKRNFDIVERIML